jgi:hypothetical protein
MENGLHLLALGPVCFQEGENETVRRNLKSMPTLDKDEDML